MVRPVVGAIHADDDKDEQTSKTCIYSRLHTEAQQKHQDEVGAGNGRRSTSQQTNPTRQTGEEQRRPVSSMNPRNHRPPDEDCS